MTPLSVWHRREQILPSHSTRVKTNICANRHGQEHIFGTIIQALQSMSAESVTDVIIFYWITETQISFFFTSPVKVKCSCTFRKNFQITFVFVVQGRYARIYYLDSISLIPNWGERRKPRMQSISCWAQLSFSFVSKQPSKVQDKRILFNGEDMWREVEGEGEGGVDNVLHLSGASSPCSPLSSRLILRILVNSGGQINSLFETTKFMTLVQLKVKLQLSDP